MFLGLWSWDTCRIHNSAATAAYTQQEHGVFSLMSEVAINSLKCRLAASLPEKHAAGLGGQWAPEFVRTFPSGLFCLTDLISQLHLSLRRHFHLIRARKGQDVVRASSEVLLGCLLFLQENNENGCFPSSCHGKLCPRTFPTPFEWQGSQESGRPGLSQGSMSSQLCNFG